jgi:hypothetical protein
MRKYAVQNFKGFCTIRRRVIDLEIFDRMTRFFDFRFSGINEVTLNPKKCPTKLFIDATLKCLNQKGELIQIEGNLLPFCFHFGNLFISKPEGSSVRRPKLKVLTASLFFRRTPCA